MPIFRLATGSLSTMVSHGGTDFGVGAATSTGVEHVFGVVKRLWRFGKVRYRGLEKNATRAFTALALANICLARNRLMAQVRP